MSTRSREMPRSAYAAMMERALSMLAWVSKERLASTSVETRPGTRRVSCAPTDTARASATCETTASRAPACLRPQPSSTSTNPASPGKANALSSSVGLVVQSTGRNVRMASMSPVSATTTVISRNRSSFELMSLIQMRVPAGRGETTPLRSRSGIPDLGPDLGRRCVVRSPVRESGPASGRQNASHVERSRRRLPGSLASEAHNLLLAGPDSIHHFVVRDELHTRRAQRIVDQPLRQVVRPHRTTAHRRPGE